MNDNQTTVPTVRNKAIDAPRPFPGAGYVPSPDVASQGSDPTPNTDATDQSADAPGDAK